MDQIVEQKLEENLEYTAAKQLFAELSQIKNSVYQNRGPMNSLLLMGVRRTATALLQRYQKEGMLVNESIKTTLSDYSKHANIAFKLSPGLQSYLTQFIEANKEELKKAKEKKDEEKSEV